MMMITKSMVRPSTPTPHELKTHQLASIDQFLASIYIPLIFFYENDRSQPQEEIVRRLKQSLSEILTVFYPLAGSIKQNSFVDCDDSGVEMTEARVQARLSQFTQNPNMAELEQFLPTDNPLHSETLILLVKISSFDCGGIALGVCMSHKVADGSSLVTFMNAWAATCRGEEASRIIHPTFDLAVHLPPSGILSGLDFLSEKKEITRRRFVFDREKVEKLRKLASSSSSSDRVKDPTKVEAVSSFLWQNFIKAYRAKSSRESETTPFIASHAVNLRPRMAPPLPDHTFGNCIWNEMALFSSPSSEEDEEEDESTRIGMLVSKLRPAIRRVDSNYINNVIKNQKYVETLKQESDLLINPKTFMFSSWRFPVYEADFGWGKPVWVCSGTVHTTNLAILMDNPSMDGIEACVNFSSTDLDFIQTFQENYDKLIS